MNEGFSWGFRAAEIVLWGSVGAIVYSYTIYPLLVAAMVRLRRRPVAFCQERYSPAVSLVISLYNEETVLPHKLANILTVEYPRQKLEVILGSDGSSDRTNDQLAAWDYPNKKVCTFKNRRGKALVLNDLVLAASGEIIVFSDANTLFEKNTLARLVNPFADATIGGVCGKLVLLPQGKDTERLGEPFYWAYENWLKRNESDFATLLGATGGVYAIRKSLFVPLPTHKSVTDDFLIPLQVVKQGFRVFYERGALAYERTSGSRKGEFLRKARIGAQNFAGIREFLALLNPRAGFVAFALWSHKIIRWFVPLLAIASLIATAILAPLSSFYAVMLACEVAFLVWAGGGFAAERAGISLGALALPYYVVSMNVALLVGFVRFLLGKQRTTWEVLR